MKATRTRVSRALLRLVDQDITAPLSVRLSVRMTVSSSVSGSLDPSLSLLLIRLILSLFLASPVLLTSLNANDKMLLDR